MGGGHSACFHHKLPRAKGLASLLHLFSDASFRHMNGASAIFKNCSFHFNGQECHNIVFTENVMLGSLCSKARISLNTR